MKNLSILCFFLAFALSAQAQFFSYSDFSSTAGLTVNGNAVGNISNGIDSDPVLRLTPNGSGGFTGSAFTTNQVDIQSFRTDFCFRLSDPDPEFTPGDGITFTIQADPAGPNALGGGGGFLGFGGIANSLTVQFDISQQTEDASGNHVGINVNGDVGQPFELNETAVSPDFDNGDLWCAWIIYENGILEVFVDNSSIQPASPTISEAVDIPGIIGQNTAHVGFTGATGSGYINQDITKWTFKSPALIPTMSQWAYFLFGLTLFSVFVVGLYNVKQRGVLKV